MILEITQYGHPVLRKKGAPLQQITDEIRQLVRDMLETMYASHGVGIAAQQVGHALMLSVIDVRESEQPSTMEIDGQLVEVTNYMPLILVNPIIKHSSGKQVGPEGCLSVPDVTADIVRAAAVEVEAQTLDGQLCRFHCGGLLARTIQHEVDHLHGILFTDRMDAATRAAFAGQLKRLQKETHAALATKGPTKLMRRRRVNAPVAHKSGVDDE